MYGLPFESSLANRFVFISHLGKYHHVEFDGVAFMLKIKKIEEADAALKTLSTLDGALKPYPSSLARFHKAFRNNQDVFILMEWVDGVPLTEAAGHYPEVSCLRQRLNLFKPVASALLSALDYMHCNLVVHRDIKPVNVLLTPDMRPVLVDFDRACSMSCHSIRDQASPPLRGSVVQTKLENGDEVSITFEEWCSDDVYTLVSVIVSFLLPSAIPSDGTPRDLEPTAGNSILVATALKNLVLQQLVVEMERHKVSGDTASVGDMVFRAATGAFGGEGVKASFILPYSSRKKV